MAETMTNAAFAVADDHQGCECKAASAFNCFRNAVDANQTLDHFRAFAFAAFAALFSAFSSTSHSKFLPY